MQQVKMLPFDVCYIDSVPKKMRLINALLAVNGQLLNSYQMPKESYPRATYIARIKIPEDRVDEFLLMASLSVYKPLEIKHENNTIIY